VSEDLLEIEVVYTFIASIVVGGVGGLSCRLVEPTAKR